jgi:hypothetical protein
MFLETRASVENPGGLVKSECVLVEPPRVFREAVRVLIKVLILM